MSADVRLFVSSNELYAGTLELTGDEHHYLSKVRRLGPNEWVTLLDGDGTCAKAKIIAMSATSSTLEVEEPQQVPQNPFQLTMASALLKGERMDVALTKMAELGVSTICPLITERTIVRLKGDRAKARHERYQSLARAAARQSQNAHPAQVQPIAKFTYFLAQELKQELKLIPCLSKGTRPLKDVLEGPALSPSSALVLIGPEGGFTEDEVELAIQAGFEPVSLGPRVLRAETANIAVATILGFHYASWDV
jgi:16S rRNA (uracil1498-N3)-methyltransferase